MNSISGEEVFRGGEAFLRVRESLNQDSPQTSLFFSSSSTSHHKKHPRITEPCWQLPSLARKLPRLLESKPWKETRPFARRRKKWARKVKRKEKRCVCRIIFYTKMDKEQRAKEREKEGERAFYLLSSLDLFCRVVVVVFSSEIFFSYWTQTTWYLLLNAPPRSTTRCLKWFIFTVVVYVVLLRRLLRRVEQRRERKIRNFPLLVLPFFFLSSLFFGGKI